MRTTVVNREKRGRKMTQEEGRISGFSGDAGSGNLVSKQVKQDTQRAAGQVTESARHGASSDADSQKQTLASGAPFGDAEVIGTPSSYGRTTDIGMADELELPDTTVFNADLVTETTDGTIR